jgi:hypothetical protein
MSKKEVATVASTEVTVSMEASAWGDVLVESKDLILPKILLQQAMSESVKQRTANDGDYLNTLTGEVVSDKDGGVEILPFFCRQSYTIEKWNGKKFEYFKSVPYVPRKQEEKDGDKFYVMDFSLSTESTKEEIINCQSWISTIKQSTVQVVDEAPSTSTAANEKRF